jgi:hypothetical protein
VWETTDHAFALVQFSRCTAVNAIVNVLGVAWTWSLLVQQIMHA